MVDESEIPVILQALSMQFSSPEEDAWIVDLPTECGDFNITIQHHGSWVSLYVMPLVENIAPEAMARLAFHLCRLNDDVVMVSFAIDADLDVVMGLELVAESVNEETIETAIHYIKYYLESKYPDIMALSKDPTAPSTYIPG